MKILGLEFAPLFIPFERRLQTFCVIKFAFIFLFGGFTALFATICLLFTNYYWIPLLYLVWYIYDKDTPYNGGRRVQWFRDWKLWKHGANYFPYTLHKTAELDPTKNYILGYHPHGITGLGGFINFGTEGTSFSDIFPGMVPHLLVLNGHFQFPFYREYLMTSGLIPAAKRSMINVLTNCGKGKVAAVIVGGAHEALEAHPGRYKFNLMKRKGFIKVALMTGSSLIPCISFGENDIYEQVPNPPGSRLRNFQEFLTQYTGFSPPIFHGRGIFQYTFGILPFRKPVHTVVGEPIDVSKIENPSRDHINALHELYCDKLKELFEKEKGKYHENEVHLELF